MGGLIKSAQVLVRGTTLVVRRVSPPPNQPSLAVSWGRHLLHRTMDALYQY